MMALEVMKKSAASHAGQDTSGLATASFTLGILSIVLGIVIPAVGILIGVVGLILIGFSKTWAY